MGKSQFLQFFRKKNMIKKVFFGIGGLFLLFLFFVLWSFWSFLHIIPHSFFFFQPNTAVLITLHNESEVRPNLGFLTGFLLLQNTEEGITLDFYDSYDVSPPDSPLLAPDVIERRFSQDVRYQGWVFRDSNFSWTFPQNTHDALEFLQYDERFKDISINSVISLDLYSIESLIDTMGGIRYNGESLKGKDLFHFLEMEVKDFDRSDEFAWLARKNGIKPLSYALLKKILFSPHQWKSLSSTIQNLLDTQHILLFSKNTDLQNLWKEKHWTGELFLPESSIPWGLNIANIGGKKGDRYIEKSVRTTFRLDKGGRITETLRIHFDHEGTRNLHSDRYYGYVRVIKPKGTQLKKYDGSFLENPKEIASEFHNFSEFDFVFYTDESDFRVLELEFTYPLSALFLEKSPQSITFFNQPGTRELPISFSVQGFSDQSISIEGCNRFFERENIGICRFTLPSSRTLSVLSLPDTTPPLFEDVLFFEEGKRVRVQFSEAIHALSLGDITLSDEDGNIYPLSGIKNDLRAFELKLLSPLDSIPRQFYKIHINTLSDVFGNSISPYIHTFAFPKYKEE